MQPERESILATLYDEVLARVREQTSDDVRGDVWGRVVGDVRRQAMGTGSATLHAMTDN
jgi:hypothetical protein